MKAFAVTGAIRSGKTTGVEAFAASLRERGRSVSGVVQVCQMLPSGGRAYLARSLAGHASALVAMVGFEGKPPLFFPEGFRWAAERILVQADVCIVDELGWLEAEGRGHWPALQQMLSQDRHGVLFVTLRQDMLARFRRVIEFEEVWRVYRGKDPPVERWVEAVLPLLGPGGP